MRKSILCFILGLGLSTAANAQYWQQQVDYSIDVSLNDTEHTLDAFEKITYINNSPDTLHYIWFHLWPNAFKNDKTAFSEQLLLNGRTDFYFSSREQKGYINRLDFKVNGITAQTADHPQYIDIIQLILPQPLPPGSRATIATPFHVQLPRNFSRGGHTGQSYQVTQWFPKPAVYDRKGWHPMPYLDQGEFYSEFGNYDVRITIPENYVVAATGELQNETEKEWLKKRKDFQWQPLATSSVVKRGSYKHIKKTIQAYPASAPKTKSLQFLQNNVHDFAWFADKRFIVQQDTLLLPSGRTIRAFSYYLPGKQNAWTKSLGMIKKAMRFRAALMGDYPYQTISAVEASMGSGGGMEYPTITSISPGNDAAQLEAVIEHEAGHNWLQGILATNERQWPWMDEGMNSYYDNRYQASQSKTPQNKQPAPKKSIPRNPEGLVLQLLESVRKDQPINTAADQFTMLNNELVGYYKTARWMKILEDQLGMALFDSCMRTYYARWQFKHPYPEDFTTVVTEVSGKNNNDVFSLLGKTGPLPGPAKRTLKPKLGLYNLSYSEKYNYISFFPAIGYNQYDKFMLGGIVHNYNLPFNALQFVAVPLYATGSKTFNGIGRISYTSYASPALYKTVYALSAQQFSSNGSLDTIGNKLFENFSKWVPSVRVYFKTPALSRITRFADLRAFFIQERTFNGYSNKTTDSVNFYPSYTNTNNRWLLQLSYNVSNNRILYPYQYELQAQTGQHFYRLNANANYFFNYAGGGGLNMRAFAAKFGYIGAHSTDAYLYQPKLLGVRGEEDYTYSNYFLGRSASASNPDGPVANQGLAAQQIMVRDGGLKLILDQYDYLQGRSENWVAALNFTSTLPGAIFPEKFPLRVFADVGTYAEAWKNNPPTSRFLYTAGLQLSLLKNILNVYLPLLYSADFKNEVKSTWPKNRFLKTISFSIDVQNTRFSKIIKNLDL